MKFINLVKTFFIVLFFSNVYGQEYFEGKIEYAIEYEAINESIPIAFLQKEIGTSFTAYVKEDRYAMIYHATGEQGWMKLVVRLDQNCTYREYEKSDTIIKTSFGLEKNDLITFKHNSDNKKEVLGELCESITIIYKPTDKEAFFKTLKGTHFYNPKYKLNAKLYNNYTDNFWNLYVNESEAISIRNESEYGTLFKSVDIATSIEETSIPNSMFEPNALKKIDEKHK